MYLSTYDCAPFALGIFMRIASSSLDSVWIAGGKNGARAQHASLALSSWRAKTLSRLFTLYSPLRRKKDAASCLARALSAAPASVAHLLAAKGIISLGLASAGIAGSISLAAALPHVHR